MSTPGNVKNVIIKSKIFRAFIGKGDQTTAPSRIANNCNYILFTKLPWQGVSEGPFGL